MSQAEIDHWTAWSNEHGVRNLPPHMREDIAMVVSNHRDGGTWTSRYLVTDRKGKGPNILGPRADEDDMRLGGRMGNLFGPQESIADSIAAAKKAMQQ